MWDRVKLLHGDVPVEVRILKLTEEVGEAAEALIGMRGRDRDSPGVAASPYRGDQIFGAFHCQSNPTSNAHLERQNLHVGAIVSGISLERQDDGGEAVVLGLFAG